MRAVVQFIEDRPRFLRAASAGLKAEGRFVIIEAENADSSPDDGIIGSGQFPTRKGFLEIFRRAGLVLVSTETIKARETSQVGSEEMMVFVLKREAGSKPQDKRPAVKVGQAVTGAVFRENEEIPEELRRQTFDFVWKKIRDDYFDPDFGGVDWAKVGEQYRPLVAEARTSAAFHALLRKMLGELRGSHLAIRAPHELTREKKPGEETRMAPEGVEVRIVEGRITVYQVKAGSPSWAAGLRPGQVVLKAGDLSPAPVEESSAARLKGLSDVRRALAGEPSNSVVMTVRDESGREKTLELPRTAPFRDRANLARAELEYSRPEPRIGYIRFDGWSFDLKAKLEPVVKDFKDTQGLIIDLRQNGGGVNPGVDYLASVLIAEPGTLASVTRRNGEKSDWKFPGGGADIYKGRVAVLVDEGSGSASEVFAGAMQEMGRAVVLGRTSYGGVLNSTQAELPTGGILQYPHSDLRTPKGGRIEGKGVVPDIPVELRRKDLLAGKDTVIERAIRALLE